LTALRETEILLGVELPLEFQQLLRSEGCPPATGFGAGTGAVALRVLAPHSATFMPRMSTLIITAVLTVRIGIG